MAWGGILELCGLFVAALTLWLSYRERLPGLHGALYARQVDAYGRVLAALADLHAVALEVTTSGTYPLDSERRLELRAKTAHQVAGLGRQLGTDQLSERTLKLVGRPPLDDLGAAEQIAKAKELLDGGGCGGSTGGSTARAFPTSTAHLTHGGKRARARLRSA